MNVLIVRNAQFENNASMQRIATALSERDYKISILSRNRVSKTNKSYSTVINKKRINVFEIGIKSKYGKNLFGVFNIIRYNIKLLKYFIKNKKSIDVIHSYDFDTGFTVRFFSRLFKKQYVYHIADFYADSRGAKYKVLKRIAKRVEFSIIKKAHTTIICTDERKEQIKGSKPKSLKVIHNTPILLNEKIEYKVDEPIKLTYVGALSKTRFIPELIDIVRSIPGIELILAGTGNLDDYVRNINNDLQNITYIGKVDYDKACNLLKETNLMIAMYDPNVKNHYFAAPNKIYESLAYNKPIIVAKNTGLSNLVESHDFGWVIDYDINALKKLLVHLVNNPHVLNTKSINTQSAFKLYNWVNTKSNIQSIYEELE